MSFPGFSNEAFMGRLAAIIAADYPAAPLKAKLRLYKNNASPDVNQTLATFVEADFDGYAAVDIAMSVPTMNDQGMVVSRSNLCDFVVEGGTDPQTIYGIYITNSANSKVIAAQRFDEPQTVGGALPTAIAGVWRTSEPLSSMGWIDVE